MGVGGGNDSRIVTSGYKGTGLVRSRSMVCGSLSGM